MKSLAACSPSAIRLGLGARSDRPVSGGAFEAQRGPGVLHGAGGGAEVGVEGVEDHGPQEV